MMDSSYFFRVTLIVLSYWVVSITITFANSYLLGDASASDLSVFIPWIQCVVTTVAAFMISYIRWKRQYGKPLMFNRETVLSKYMLGLGANFSFVLILNNLTLKHVGVAFFLVARALTLVFTVILNYFILSKSASLRTLLCCAIVISGFFLGIDQERFLGSLSLQGVFYGVLSSVVIALNGILQKGALDNVVKDVTLFTLYENFNASVFFFIPLILSGQLNMVYTIERALHFSFWFCLIISGLLGFLMAWIIALQMDYTSPLTCNISNNTKSVLQTIIATFVAGQHKSKLWWLSNCLVIGGAALYTYVKLQETAKKETPRSKGLEENSNQVIFGSSMATPTPSSEA